MDRRLRLLALATAVACPVFLLGLYVDSIVVRLPAKPWIHLLLIAWVLGPAASPYARRIAAGLALCMIADVLLEFRRTHFVYGMGMFLFGHVAFASAFVMRSRELRLVAALPFAAWIAVAFGVVGPGLGAMRVPVVVYMAAIGTMMWRAAVWALAAPVNSAARWALAGAVVFGISDTIIALDYFHAPVAGARYFIIATYWAALAMIAASAKAE